MGIKWRGDFIAITERFGVLRGLVFDVTRGCPVLADYSEPYGDLFPVLIGGKVDIIFSVVSDHYGDYGYNTRYHHLVPSWVVPNQCGGSLYEAPIPVSSGKQRLISFKTRILREDSTPPYLSKTGVITYLGYAALSPFDPRCLLDFSWLPYGATRVVRLAFVKDYATLDYRVTSIYESASGNSAWCYGYGGYPLLAIHLKSFVDVSYYGDYHRRFFHLYLLKPESAQYELKFSDSLDRIADEYLELLVPIKRSDSVDLLRLRMADNQFYVYGFSSPATSQKLTKVGYFPKPYWKDIFLAQTGSSSAINKWYLSLIPYWRGSIDQTEEGDFLVWVGGMPVVETWVYAPPYSVGSSSPSFWQDKWSYYQETGDISYRSPSFVGLYWLDYSNRRIVMVDFWNKMLEPVFITNFLKVSPREYYLALYNTASRTTTLGKVTWDLGEKKIKFDPILTRDGIGFGYLGVANISGSPRLVLKQYLDSPLEIVGEGIAEEAVVSLEKRTSTTFPFTTNLRISVRDVFGNSAYARVLVRCETANVSFADGTTQKIIRIFPGEEAILPVEIKRTGKIVITTKVLETRL